MSVQDLHDILAQWDANPRSAGVKLRLDLSLLVIQRLNKNGWTHKQLAEKAGVTPWLISRIVLADANCTFETAGRILFALGVKPKLRATPKAKGAT